MSSVVSVGVEEVAAVLWRCKRGLAVREIFVLVGTVVVDGVLKVNVEEACLAVEGGGFVCFLSDDGREAFLGAGRRLAREDPAFAFFIGRTSSPSSSPASLAKARGRDTLITRFFPLSLLSGGCCGVGLGAGVSSSSSSSSER